VKVRIRGIDSLLLNIEHDYERRIEKKKILRKVLTRPAKGRLTRIKLVYPRLAEMAENRIVEMYEDGKIGKIPKDEQWLIKKVISPIVERYGAKVKR